MEKEAIYKGLTVEELIIEKGLISNEVLGQIAAEYFGVLFVNLRTEIISEDILKIIPELVAKNQQIIAFKSLPFLVQKMVLKSLWLILKI